jgi:hypothetical protein
MGWFDCRGRGLGISLFTTAFRTALGPTQPPIQWVPKALTVEVKWPGREVDYSPVWCRDQRMSGAIPLLPQYVFMVWCLVKHSDNFIHRRERGPTGSHLKRRSKGLVLPLLGASAAQPGPSGRQMALLAYWRSDLVAMGLIMQLDFSWRGVERFGPYLSYTSREDRITGQGHGFLSLHHFRPALGAPPASCQWLNGGVLLESKAAGAWIWGSGGTAPLPHTSSWRGTSLSTGTSRDCIKHKHKLLWLWWRTFAFHKSCPCT